MEREIEIIKKMYINEGKNGIEIAKILGYKSSTTVYNKMDKAGIKRKCRSSCQFPFNVKEEELKDMYINQNKTLRQIANYFNTSEETIRRKLIFYNIERRDIPVIGGWNKGGNLTEEQKEKLSKTRKDLYRKGLFKHWNKGNKWGIEVREKISKTLLKGRDPAPSYYGDDWKIQRTSCLQRDNYTCQQCGSKEKIEVHHWEPYRFSYNNSLDNLITLCFYCHREIHKEYIEEGFIYEAEVYFYG